MIRLPVFLAMLGLAIPLAAATPAAATTCTSRVVDHTVASGDTLSRIAKAAYGEEGHWPRIFEHPGNASAIGNNPNVLTIGTILKLPPCPGSVTVAPDETAVPAPEIVAETQDDALLPSIIYIVTGDDWAPYVSKDWPKGGMATLIVKAAFEEAGLGDRIRVHHINDWNAQIKELVPANRYQLTFGWAMPDMGFWKTCNRLPADMQVRCSYDKSKPILTTTLGFFREIGRSDLAEMTFEDLKTARLCRPTGWSTFELVENGLSPDNWVGTDSPAACFNLLMQGEVDFVVLNRFTGIATATEMGIRQNVEMAPFTVPHRIYLLAHKDNPLNTTGYLDAFNLGLQRIVDNGKYGQISSFFNDEFARRAGGK